MSKLYKGMLRKSFKDNENEIRATARAEEKKEEENEFTEEKLAESENHLFMMGKQVHPNRSERHSAHIKTHQSYVDVIKDKMPPSAWRPIAEHVENHKEYEKSKEKENGACVSSIK